jgi:hypothetical protein
MDEKLWQKCKIKNKPNKKDQELLNACYFGNIIGVKKWLKLGADPSVKNCDGNKASDMTVEPELKFLFDNFDKYQEILKNEKHNNE